MEETDIVMAEIEGGSQEYTVYAFLSFLFVHLLHFRRPVTDTFLVPILSQVLFNWMFSRMHGISDNPHLKGIADHKKRLSIIAKDMLQFLYVK